MNKKYLVIILGVIAIIVLTYFISTIRPETEVLNNNFTTLSIQSKKQAENIATNGKTIKLLLDEITKLRQSIFLASKYSTQPANSFPDDDLSSLDEGEDLAKDPRAFMQVRKEKSRVEQERRESIYEAALNEGENDERRTDDINTKIEGLITSKEIGVDVHLQSVECRTNLCKVNIFHSDKTSLNRGSLVKSLGQVSIYGRKLDSSTQGQQEIVLYISKEGEKLPLIHEK